MSKKMRRAAMAGALAVGALGVCGGFVPGAATAVAAPSPNPFTGAYRTGWWPVPVQVSGSGKVYGNYTIQSDSGESGGSGKLSGHVGRNGSMSISGSQTYSVFPTGYETSSFKFTATAARNADGSLAVVRDDGTTETWQPAW